MITRMFTWRRHHGAPAAALSIVLALSACAARSAQPLPEDVIATRVDAMAEAYTAKNGPASMSIAISRGDEVLFEGPYETTITAMISAADR